MNRILTSLALLACLSPGLAFAQTPATRVRGAIASISGAEMNVMQADGTAAAIHLADNFQVAAIGKGSLADIKPGTFIGAGARPQPDGTQVAVQVVIFPEAMRGTGEGHRAWAVLPEATMTNATVADTVASVNGPLMTLKYKDGEKKLSIPADALILTFGPADKSALVAGVQVQLFATKATDGSLTATRVTLIKDGVNPM